MAAQTHPPQSILSEEDATLIEKPLDKSPDTAWGATVFRGTRVPIATLFDYLDDGQALSEFRENFPHISRQQISAALDMARRYLEQNPA